MKLFTESLCTLSFKEEYDKGHFEVIITKKSCLKVIDSFVIQKKTASKSLHVHTEQTKGNKINCKISVI